MEIEVIWPNKWPLAERPSTVDEPGPLLVQGKTKVEDQSVIKLKEAETQVDWGEAGPSTVRISSQNSDPQNEAAGSEEERPELPDLGRGRRDRKRPQRWGDVLLFKDFDDDDLLDVVCASGTQHDETGGFVDIDASVRDKRDSDKDKEREITSGWLMAIRTGEIKIRICYFEAVYTLQKIKASNTKDDSLYFHEHSQLIPTIHPLPNGDCTKIWSRRKFKLPGFGDQAISITREEMSAVNQAKNDVRLRKTYSATFIREGDYKGIEFAEPVSWTDPLGT